MKRLELLDYGRFAAVSAVVAFHYFFNGIQGGKIASMSHVLAIIEVARYGYLGVEFFFLISGYVIFFSAREKTAGEFLSARAVRLYPAFWIAMLITAAAAQAWGGKLMSVNTAQLAANFTMFPDLFGQPYVDGVYWTLAYEWRFYLAVFIAIALGLQSRLELLFVAWPFYIAAAQLIELNEAPLASGFYGFFAAGALFALHRQKRMNVWLTVPALILSLYLCLHYAMLRAGDVSAAISHELSPTVVGVIVIGMFAFLQFLNSKMGSGLRLPGSRLAGGMTYPMYLLHAHLGYMLLTRFGDDQNRVLIYPVVIGMMLALAAAVHLVERRHSAFWRAAFGSSVGRIGDKLQTACSRTQQRLYTKLAD